MPGYLLLFMPVAHYARDFRSVPHELPMPFYTCNPYTLSVTETLT